ncbi:MAG: S41 family peptidase [Bacteroidales bacterium]|nr:S41 family peptidase [Bacteroidales bacterium]
MKHLIIALFCVILAFSFHSCVLLLLIDTEDASEDNPNKYVNDWISETMDDYYYWEDKMPSSTDKTLYPDAYFESLLYQYDAVSAPDGDRFSWISEDWQELVSSIKGVEANEIGFDYVLYLKEKGSTAVIGQVTYTKKGTPAEAAGIKRGMLFDKVNGSDLTTSNYYTLLSTTAGEITFGFLNVNYTDEGTFNGYTSGQSLIIQTLASYSENPVYLDSVYQISGHKVGYLVYHFFAPDGGTNDAAYDVELNRVFGGFKNAGITDLVLDLRYNSGGYSSSAQLLASLIVPNLSKSNVFTYYDYSDFLNNYYLKKYGKDFFNTYFTESVMNGEVVLEAVNNIGNNLGGRVVVLTGRYTASASEQVINGLKPYMESVILIGDTTYGKNVASYSLYEKDDSKNKWGLQPIVAKYFNKNNESDFTAGFRPNYVVDDTGLLGIKPLGDVNENLLNKALFVLGIINNPNPVETRSGNVQKNRMLRSPTHIERGLQLNKMPILE